MDSHSGTLLRSENKCVMALGRNMNTSQTQKVELKKIAFRCRFHIYNIIYITFKTRNSDRTPLNVLRL